MLEFAEDVTEASRLACQITLSDALDGLVLRLPDRQH
jgi:2Fe-2S ferredoxin